MIICGFNTAINNIILESWLLILIYLENPLITKGRNPPHIPQLAIGRGRSKSYHLTITFPPPQRPPLKRGPLFLYDEVCYDKTDHHDILVNEILLKVTFSTHNPISIKSKIFEK